jgi:hypothetical protein
MIDESLEQAFLLDCKPEGNRMSLFSTRQTVGSTFSDCRGGPFSPEVVV